MGHIRRPSRERIKALAALEHMHLTDTEAPDLERLLDKALDMFDTLDTLPQPEIALEYATRGRGHRPSPEEDPFNAFIRKCRVEGAREGKLAGRKVGLKDNIRLAGVPMTNGSMLLADYVPTND